MLLSVSDKGRTIRKVMGRGGGGGGGFSAGTNFFFSRTTCAGIFFPGETPCTNFFFRQILLFFNSEILIHYLCFCETIELRKQHIKNLSDTQLTTEQINLPSRGLKFISTPVMKENQIRRQLISDFNQFARRIRLQYIYHDQNTKQHPFHVKSSWIPPIQRSVALETYLEEVKIKLAELHWLNLKIICHPARNKLSRSLLTTKKLFSKRKIKAQQPSF